MNERERAVALYTFLKEFSQLRTRTVRDVDTYEQVIWVSDVPQQPGCDCIAWHRDVDDVSDKPWIEIRRPRLRRPPEPPELTRNWVRREQLNDSSLVMPELHTTLLELDRMQSDSSTRNLRWTIRPSLDGWPTLGHEVLD